MNAELSLTQNYRHMPRNRIVAALVLLLPLACASGCSRFAVDSTTPEGAVLVFDAAYQKKDLEAIVAARDFRAEARLMLKKLQPILVKNDGLVQKTADTLETTFRTKVRAMGFPGVAKIESTFVSREDVGPGLIRVHEKHSLASGETETRTILVAKSKNGWRVVKVET